MIHEPPAPVPVIIFGGFCNWLEFNEVLGFWDEIANATNAPYFVYRVCKR